MISKGKFICLFLICFVFIGVFIVTRKENTGIKNIRLDQKYTNSSKTSSSYYEVVGNKISFYGDGKYNKNECYSIDNENLVQKLIKIIMLIKDKKEGYLYLRYIEDDGYIFVQYAENEQYAINGQGLFSIKIYDSVESSEYEFQIEVIKLWRDINKFKSGEYIDEDYKNILDSVCSSLLDENVLDKILNIYINSLDEVQNNSIESDIYFLDVEDNRIKIRRH